MRSQAGSSSTQGAETILNVNDDAAIRYVLSHTLKAAGYTVVEATHGREAIEKASSKLDLILLDIRLPDVDGFQVCETIQADPLTAKIPVLMISANFVRPSDKATGLGCGAVGYLTHPIKPEELIRAVQDVLSKTTENSTNEG